MDVLRVKRAFELLAQNPSLVGGYETNEGHDEGPYINFTFLAKNSAALWKTIQKEILANPDFGTTLSKSAIIVCEGKKGWDDYLLLYHFDQALVLDEPDKV